MNIKEELFKMQDKKYQEFQSKLCPGVENIIGIRIPTLRKFARENKEKIEVNDLETDYYEEILLKGMLIGMQTKLDYEEIKKFLPLIDNWAVCDTFCAGLKQVKKHKEEFLEFIKPYLKSKNEFEVRFAVVILIDYYIDEEHIDYVLQTLSEINQNEYYVKMAIAWCYSICFVKNYNKTFKLIQKARESFRLTNKQKTNLKRL